MTTQKIERVKLINGDEINVYENTEEAKDVIAEMVLNNDTISFHSSPIEQGTLTIEVL